ncbi:MAG: formate dehydrogenase [Gammaproteobacteria bacterium]|nr:formate dehydrogenase [Gammaproteobacteria bacterium]
MNKKQSSLPNNDRRNFLKGVVVGGSATALSSVSADLFTKDHVKTKIERAKAQTTTGYHETPHIQAYYQSLRNP